MFIKTIREFKDMNSCAERFC